MAGISKRHVSRNLFDKSNANYFNGYYDYSNNKIASYSTNRMLYIPVEQGKTYTISGIIRYNMNITQRYMLTTNAPVSGEVPVRSFAKSVSAVLTFTAENNENYLCVMICGDSDYTGYGSVNDALAANTANIMFNEGETPLPYEPYGDTWNATTYGIMKTATDTITTLPADVYADGTAATIGLKGNMSQTGTPTPQNPIQPQETGERTGNLFDFSQISWKNAIKNDVGAETDSAVSHYTTNFTEVKPETTYCLGGNLGIGEQAHRIYFYDENKTWLSRSSALAYNVPTFTTPINCKYVQFQAQQSISGIDWMLVEGSTALPHEPYGIKIPISSADTTTPVYLGEVETTRKIKKLVLTGEETWTLQSINSYGIANFYTYIAATRQSALCTHFEQQTSTIANTRTEGFLTAPSSGSRITFYIRILETTAATKEELKAWLSAQYSNGTPVIIWYVDETQQAAIVNEPIRKIGDYADTVSGISIPTITGADSFDVLTTLKPSEVSANYHGWHTGTVHERESGQWD